MPNTIEDYIRVVDMPEDDPVRSAFLSRAQEGSPTRDENPQTHFCVYFAAIDPVAERVFIGHHKKSGLWLFNGGHIDRGETLSEALLREIEEEWGWDLISTAPDVGSPQLMTITEIDNPLKQTCTRHYDFWYLLPMDHVQALFDADLLSKEFHDYGWLTLPEARDRVTDPATLKALDFIKQRVMS
jgi:8-oxo-dGTP pyrophosphatase MutT (NUDIX family)